MKPLLLAAALALLVFLPRDATACSCVPNEGPPITPKVWFDRFDGAAFRGTILKAEALQTGQPGPLTWK
jgi:hypothetical protein